MVDLPGTYSIEGFSQEEKVSLEYLLNEDYDGYCEFCGLYPYTEKSTPTPELLI